MNVVTAYVFEPIREIGAGKGMNSRVFLAYDPQLAAEVAVKVVPKVDFGNSPEAFFVEAQAVFAARHENVVNILTACQTDDAICLVMPFYENGSLADRLSTGPLSLKAAMKMADHVLAGLAQVHVSGFVHFDIKPSNILYSDVGVPMLADFGQSRRMGPGGVVAMPLMYRWGFVPEGFQNSVGVFQSDVYQVGMTLYRALNGNRFFDDQKPAGDLELRDAVLAGTFPDRDRFRPHVPLGIRRVLRKALDVDPMKRQASPTVLANELGQVDLPLDWTMTHRMDGGLTWKATRPDRPTLVVEFAPNGKRWNVDTFTEREDGVRRNKKGLCSSGLTEKQANACLNRVFRQLSRP